MNPEIAISFFLSRQDLRVLARLEPLSLAGHGTVRMHQHIQLEIAGTGRPECQHPQPMGHLVSPAFYSEEAEARGNSMSCRSPTATSAAAPPVATTLLLACSQPPDSHGLLPTCPLPPWPQKTASMMCRTG